MEHLQANDGDVQAKDAYLQVVALGPDRKGQLTLEAADALKAADLVVLRTRRHGAVAWMREQGIAFEALDSLHEQADDFDTLIASVADAVQRKMQPGIRLCYAVAEPQTDETVRMLAARNVRMRVLAGVTHASGAQARALEAGIPGQGGLCVIPAMDIGAHRINPSMPLVITELNSRLLAGDVKLALLEVYAPDTQVLLCGNTITLEALDRFQTYNHLSTVYVPACPYSSRERYVFGDLLDIMARLRDPANGCPWDVKQTHQSLREYVIEEAYEVVEAIDQQDDARIADELGDVMLQVVFHAQVAREHGTFSIGDVTTAICHKMITRHAHIFGDVHCETADDVLRSWEAIKKKEKGLESNADGMRDIPKHLPALMRADKVQSKGKRVGYPWGTARHALDKLQEQVETLCRTLESGQSAEAEWGDVLFGMVNAARLSGIQLELALGQATERFIHGFNQLEKLIAEAGKQLADMSFEEMDMLWRQVKQKEVNAR